MPPIPQRPPKIIPDLRRGYGVVCLGDSIIGGSGPGGVGNLPFDLACILSDQRIPFLANLGVGGEDIDDVMARIPDVIALNPSHCVICCGTNSWGDADFVTQLGLYAQGIQRLRGAGIEPIICLPPARSQQASASRITQMRFMYWMRDYCKRYGLMLVDWWRVTADSLSGDYASGMGWGPESPGFVHPSVAGAKAMAQELVDRVSPLFPPNSAYVEPLNAAGINLITDGCMGVDTNDDGVPNGWFGNDGGGGTVTFSRVLDTGSRYWFRMDVTAAPSSSSMSRPISGWSVGDVLDLSFRMRTANNQSGEGGFYIQFDTSGASPTTYPFYNRFPYDIEDHRVAYRMTVPTGTTSISFRLGWQAGTFQVDITEVTVINRTTQLAGLA